MSLEGTGFFRAFAPDAGAAPVRRQLIAAVAAGGVVLALMVAAAAWLTARNRETGRWTQHTYQVESAISDLQTEVEKIENARRGYLLSPSPAPLSVARESTARIPVLIERVEELTADNAIQQERLVRLRPLIETKLVRVDATVGRARRGDLAGAVADYAASDDPALMVALRGVMNAMRAEETRLLAARLKAERGNATALFVAILATAVLLVAVGGGSLALMLRFAQDLERSQTALRALNTGLEDVVRSRTADLRRANEEIQRFAYIVSHDLRSPLVNVMGFTSELEQSLGALRKQLARADESRPETVSKDVREAIERDIPESIDFIRRSSEKMDRLINAILKLSRQGRRTLTPEPLDLHALAENAAASLAKLAEGRGASMTVASRMPALTSDRLALEQVLSNLLENAVKYLQPGRPGRIEVRGGESGGRVLLEVEDNGRGIAPQDLERVFELFRRSGAQDVAGEGIGLAHVRALVYRLGGTISCVSELGRGTTFRVHLPSVLAADHGHAAA